MTVENKVFPRYLARNLEEFNELKDGYKVLLENYELCPPSEKELIVIVSKKLLEEQILINPETSYKLEGIRSKGTHNINLEKAMKNNFFANPEGVNIRIAGKKYMIFYEHQSLISQ